MVEKTNLNITPYYDDYDDDKSYHKVLYRAGRPIQARELTQTQTILQSQIERLGGHFFKEGSLVQGAQLDINSNNFFVKLKSANPNALGDDNVNSYLSDFHGKYLRGQTSGVVFKVSDSTTETTDDPATIYGNFITQGTTPYNTFSFTSNEILEEVTLNSDGVPTVNAGNNNQFQMPEFVRSNPSINRCLTANISEGLVYTRGYFVKVPKQSLILEKYTAKGTYKVGLSIVESRVSSADDVTLNDNSQGTSNENSAGADRLKLSLVLAKELIQTTENLNFIELGRVLQGAVKGLQTKSVYGEFENTLARRTYDSNGDFIVQKFIGTVREHLNTGINNGLYTQDQNGKEDKFIFEVSKGQAYVKGYDITKISTSFLTVDKARETISLDGASTSVRLGNNIKVTNAHSFPDIGSETTSTNTFGIIKLYDDIISTPGSAPSANHIGYARVRDISLFDGTDTSGIYDDTSVFNLSCFDIKMFARITGTTSGATFESGDKVTGATSGATGIVAFDVASGGSEIFVHDLTGTFQTGEAINARTNAATIASSTAFRSFNIDRVRSVFGSTASGGTDFTADLVLDSNQILTGTVTLANGSTNVSGFLTRFVDELKEGDVIVSGDGTEVVVLSVTDETTATLSASYSGSDSTGNVTRKRSKIEKPEQTSNIFALPRDYVATSVVGSNTIRKQEIVTISGGQFVVETGIANTELGSVSDPDAFVIGVLAPGSGGSPTLAIGDLIDLTDPLWNKSVTTGGGGIGEKLTVTGGGLNADDNNAQLLITYTVDVTSQTKRSKTIREARCLSFESPNSSGVFYGTAYDHKDLSLGVGDVFKVRGVFEGTGGTTPLPPNAQFQDPTNTFTTFETVLGQTTGARAKIIKYNSLGRSYFYYETPNLTFNEGEFIVGQSSNSQATISGLDEGSLNIKDRYFFDNGQRDGYYDLAKLSLKQGSPAPSNPILVVFDYFTSSGGDYYDVGSYTGIDYDQIPNYSPNKVDLGGLEPDGTFELSDAIDCRPTVGQVLGTSSFSSGSPDPALPINISDNAGSGARYSPFSYENGRSFLSSRPNITVTGSAAVHTPTNGTSFNSDISFYVARIDRVFLSKKGNFQIAKGIAALTPTKPGAVQDTLELFEIYVPAYTRDIKKISIKSKDYRRYTMSDIDRINKRLTNLEQVTALSLLESSALSKQILDGDGLDRFKSGFVVDNFNNHSIGDVLHPDYSCSIDSTKGQVRPACATVEVDMKYNSALSKNCFKHRDNIVTLPYSVINYVNADKASRSISVNPYIVYDFKGQMTLSPSQDLWFDMENTETKREGDTLYSAVTAATSDAAKELGSEDGETYQTIWNSWQSEWSGETITENETQNIAGGWDGDPTQDGNWIQGTTITRTVTEQTETQTRNGISLTRVDKDPIVTTTSRVSSGELVQYMREKRSIDVAITGLKPNTNHFTFFDEINVDKYITPYTGYSNNVNRPNAPEEGDGLISDFKGQCFFKFHLPNSDELRFKTGQRMLKVTSSLHNQSNPSSAATAEYRADGTILNQDTEITTTRHVLTISEAVSETAGTITHSSESLNFEPYGVTTNSIDVPADTYNITNVTNVYAGEDIDAAPQELPEETDPVSQDETGPNLSNPGEAEDDVTQQIVLEENFENGGATFVVISPGLGPDGFVTNEIDTTCWNEGTCTLDVDVYSGIGVANVLYHEPGDGDFDWESETDSWITQNDVNVAVDDYIAQTAVASPESNLTESQIADNVTYAYPRTEEEVLAVLNEREVTRNNICYFDPLAQSFLVTTPGGCFVHNIETYFSKKDTNGSMITCELRTMQNGHPGNKIIASTTLTSDLVYPSDNATLKTQFKFSSPVFLQENTEYCFVLISPSVDYEVWHSRLGEVDITTGQQISTQPYLGSMFKSQNAKTWTSEQTDDIKFRLNICSFNKNYIGYMRLENTNVTWKKLKTNPIETFLGEGYVKVNAYSHGMYDTDSSVRIKKLTGDRKNSVVEISNTTLAGSPSDGVYTDLDATYVSGSGGSGLKLDVTIAGGVITDTRISDVGQGYAVSDSLQILNFNSSADVTFEVADIEDTIGGFPIETLSYRSATPSKASFSTISNITMDSFCVTPDTSSYQGNNKLKSSWTALNTTKSGGRGAQILKNVYYDVGQTLIPHHQPQGTKVFSNIYPTSMKSPDGIGNTPYSRSTTSTFFTLNDNIYFDTPNVVASAYNEVQKMQSNRSLDVRIQFYTENQFVSPVFDIESMGFVGVMNRINSIGSAGDVPDGTTYVASTEPDGDNNKFVYTTRKIELQTPASSIKVFSDNFRPLGTELEFMYKIIKSDEETPVDDLGWEYFNSDGSPDILIDPDSRSFKEYTYTVDNLPEFISFAIKIVGKSQNTCKVPTVTSFRALALA